MELNVDHARYGRITRLLRLPDAAEQTMQQALPGAEGVPGRSKGAAAMSRQRGVALITVLLVVAIVTVVSAAMVARQQLSIRATSNQLQARQAWHYALGGEALAQAILARDLRSAAGADPGASGEAAAVDHLLEPWAQPLPAFEIDQGEILVRIEDMAGRFNLNDLLRDQQPNPAAVEQFRRLLLRLQISAPYPERLLDWLDPDQQPSGELGAEDNAYLSLDPPYRSAGRRLHDLPSCACCWTCARKISSVWRPTWPCCRVACH